VRCFYVLVHGELRWRTELAVTDDPDVFRPTGFYCHRYVLASDANGARDEAFRRVRENLEQQTGWVTNGLATVDLHAEKVTDAAMHKLLKPDNRGHTFYIED
jgi:hypothetical protein